jgi:hypothetical protein
MPVRSQVVEFPPRIPLRLITLIAAAVHLPLLLMRLPLNSYDANFHIFFSAHYAKNWFNPWNEKWFTGFSQTTYPPLGHQWIALLSNIFSLEMAYLLVQGVTILLLPIGMYRYARLWVGERAASYAALGAVFLGSLSFLVYQSGQLSTTFASALYLNTLPYMYEWIRDGRKRAFFNGLILVCTAAVAHHVTLIFCAALYVIPVILLAITDRDKARHSVGGVLSRTAAFGVASIVGVLVVLLPYWVSLLHNPIRQVPIPHASRSNYILSPEWGINYWIIPWGALALALPFVAMRAFREHRLRPLFFGFYVTFLLGLGGTTPAARWLLGRAFEIVTFERFNFWASLMVLPIVGLLSMNLIARYRRRAMVGLWIAAVATCATAVAWTKFHPINAEPFKTDEVIAFLNEPGKEKYRYLTLGFGIKLSEVGTYARPGSVDGDYNSARNLPEMTKYGSAQFGSSKYYGLAGMDSLRAVLKRADYYSLRYVFVRDPFYEPLLEFTGWRKTRVFDSGNITLWENPHVREAVPMKFGFVPPRWHGFMWGFLPITCSVLALAAVTLFQEKPRPLPQIRQEEREEEYAVLRQAT